MKKKPFLKKLARLTGRYFIYLCLGLIKILPAAAMYYITGFIAKIGYFSSRKYRRRTLNNLTLAFGDEKREEEKRRIAQRLFHQITLGAAEITKLSFQKDDACQKVKDKITVVGREHLDKALEKKKGVILVSAHFGNFSLLTWRLSLEGYKCNMVVRDANDPAVSKIWYEILDRLGIRHISAQGRQKAIGSCLRWLKDNNLLCLFADQNKTTGIYVDFFTKPAGTVEGPALFSLRTGAPILCAFIIRLTKDKHKIVITEPIEAQLSENEEEDLYNITQSYTRVIEDFARTYPDHWWWVHDRWKGAERLKRKNVKND
jgi:Kdo2-lipid IVA lauroyltransferase/acyltransferase